MMTEGSAGYDLYAAEDAIVPPSRVGPKDEVNVGRYLIPTGIAIELPPSTVGRIASRSGPSVKYNVEAGAGWIDPDYRGQIMVELKNFSSTPFTVAQGDRIAQLFILPTVLTEFVQVDQLGETKRDASGFGSTGSSA